MMTTKSINEKSAVVRSSNSQASYVECQSINTKISNNISPIKPITLKAKRSVVISKLHAHFVRSEHLPKDEYLYIAKLCTKDDQLRLEFNSLSKISNVDSNRFKKEKTRIKLDWRNRSKINLQGWYERAKVNPTAERVAKLLEDILITLGLSFKACTKDGVDGVSITLAVLNFFKLRSSRSLVFDDRFTDAVEYLIDGFAKIVKLVLEEPTLQSDSTSKPLPVRGMNLMRQLLDGYVKLKHLPIMKKIGDVCTYLVTLSVFDSIGETCIRKDTWKLIKKGCQKEKVFCGPDFIHCLLDCLVFVCERGYQCLTLGSWQPLAHSGDAYEKWIEEAEDILSKSEFLGNPEAVGFDISGFKGDLFRLIEQGEAIKSASAIVKVARHMVIVKKLLELKYVRDTYLTFQSAQKDRKTPLGLLVYGGSGVAKSTFTHMLFKHFGRVRNKPTTDQYKYTRNANDKFWSGFRTYVWFLILDDVAALKPGICPNGDESIKELLQIINQIAYNPNQADLKDKGKNPFDGEFVVATTNVPNINIEEYYNFPLAAHRRLPYAIELCAKPQYSRDHMLNTDALPVDDGGLYPDYWQIKVFRIKPVVEGDKVPSRATFEPLLRFDDSNEFLHWFTTVIQSHFKVQTRVSASLRALDEMELCKGCFLPKCMCNSSNPGSAFNSRYGVGLPLQSRKRTYFVEYNPNYPKSGEILSALIDRNNCDVIRISTDYNHFTSESHYLDSGFDILRDHLQHKQEKVDMIIGCSSYSPVYLIASMRELPFWYPGSRRVINPVLNSYQSKLLEFFCRKEPTVKKIIKCDIDTYSSPSNIDFEAIFIENKIEVNKIRSNRVPPSRFSISIHDVCTKLYNIHSDLTCLTIFGCALYGKMSDVVFGNFIFALYAYSCVMSLGTYAGTKAALKAEARRVGNRIQLSCGNPSAAKYCAVLAGCVVSAVIIKKILSCLFSAKDYGSCQADIMSKGSNFAPTLDNKKAFPNATGYQYSDLEELTPAYFPSDHSGVESLKSEEHLSRVSNNVIYGRYEYIDGGELVVNKACLLALGGNYFITTKHSVPNSVASLKLVLKYVKNNHLSTVTISHTPKNIVKEYGQECLILKYESVNPYRKIDYMFLNKELMCTYKPSGNILIRDFEGELSQHRIAGAQVTVIDADHIKNLKCYSAGVSKPTVKGTCGSPWLVDTYCGPTILGIHVAGYKNMAYCVPVLSDVYDGLFVIQQGSVNAGKVNLQTLSKNSCLRKLTGNCDVFGTLANAHQSSMVSAVRETFICEDIASMGYPKTHLPPPFGKEGNKTWSMAVEKHLNINHLLPDEFFQNITKAFFNVIMRDLPHDELNELGVCSLDNAIRGIPGVQFLDPLKKNTSAGFGNPGKKIKYLKFEGKFLTDGMYNQLQEIEDVYSSNTTVKPIFVKFPKDEALPKAKVLIKKKFRLVSCSGMAWTIWVRMHYLPIVRLIMRNIYVFRSAPGIAAQSKDWDRLYKFLSKNPLSNCIASDYTGFDQTLMPNLILNSLNLLIEIAIASGKYSEDELNMMRTANYDMAFPVYISQCDVFQSWGSNPSGNPLTVIINCICNIYLMMTAWTILRLKENKKYTLEEFFEYVCIMVYGDDNIMTVSNSAKWFNHTTISTCLQPFGVVLTMADKDAESVPFIDISQVEFLKRSFRYEPELDAFVGPLREESIIKSLMIGIPSGTISDEEQIVMVMSSALQEFFLHGKVKFDLWHVRLSKIRDKYDLGHFAKPSLFPTWEQLKTRYSGTEASLSFKTSAQIEVSAISEIPSNCIVTADLQSCSYQRMDIVGVESQNSTTAQYCCGLHSSQQSFNLCFKNFKTDCCIYKTTQKSNIATLQADNAISIMDPTSAGMSALNMVASVVGEAARSGISQAAGEAVTETLSNVRQAVQSKAYSTAKAGFQCVSNPSDCISQYMGSQSSIPTSRIDGVKDAPSRTNNVGGSVLCEGNEEEHATLYEWLLERGGEKLFIQNKYTNPSFLNSIQPSVELNKFLSRPVVINRYAYSASSTLTTEISPWKLIADNPKIAKKLDDYAQFRANLNIKAVCHSSPFLFGGVLLTYRPFSTNKSLGSTNLDLCIRSQRKNIYVYPQTSSGGTMQVPFFYPEKFFDRKNGDLADLGTLAITPLVPLRTSNGSATGNVTITIYAWFTEVYTTGATLQSDHCLEDIKDSAGRISAEPREKNLEYMGGVEASETSIQHIISKDAIFNSISVATSTAPQTLLARFVGNPMYFLSSFRSSNLVPSGGQPYVPNNYFRVVHTPLSYIGNLFDYWEGDILIRCKILKTPYHRGRLHLIYDPLLQPLTVSDSSSTALSNKIIDIGETDEFVFNIPYITPNVLLKTGSEFQIGTTGGGSVRAISRFDDGTTTLMEGGTPNDRGLFQLDKLCSGVVSIYLDSELKAPGNSSDPIQLLFYVSGAPNFRFYRPVGFEKRSINADPAFAAANLSTISANSYLYEQMNNPAVALQASIERYKIHEFGHVDDHKLSETITSEKIVDLKTLLRTFMYHKLINVATSDSDDMRLCTTNWNGFPWSPGFYGSNIGNLVSTSVAVSASNVAGSGYVSNNSGAVTGTGEWNYKSTTPNISYTDTTFAGITFPNRATYETCAPTYIPYICGLFCGHRGDIDWRVRVCTNVIGNVVTVAKRALTGHLTSGTGAAVTGITSGSFWSNQNGLEGSGEGAQFYNNSDGGVIKIKSPFMTDRLFYTVDSRYRDGRRQDASYDRGINLTTLLAAQSSRARMSYLTEVAAADDFEPLYFIGTPNTYRIDVRNY